jgi:hypothetical protein
LAELENMDEGGEPDLSKAKNNKSSEPDLPIEEDGIAHVLLKRLLNFEQSLDTQNLAEAVVEDNHLIDTSMWMHPHKFPERKVAKKSNKKKNKTTTAVVENGLNSYQLYTNGSSYFDSVCMYVSRKQQCEWRERFPAAAEPFECLIHTFAIVFIAYAMA